MFVSPETMAVLLECVPPDRIMDVVNAFGRDAEAMTPKLSDKPNAVRQRRFKAKRRGESVTESVTGNGQGNGDGNEGSFLSVSLPPTPPNPSTNLSPVAPYSPPKDAKKPSKTAPLAEQIFLLQPKRYRRSTTPDIRMALDAAAKRGADLGELLEALTAYYRHPDSLADDGKFAKGAHRLIQQDRWRDYLPRPEPPAIVNPAEQQWRLDHYRATREWKPSWGERPKDAA